MSSVRVSDLLEDRRSERYRGGRDVRGFVTGEGGTNLNPGGLNIWTSVVHETFVPLKRGGVGPRNGTFCVR